MDGQTCRQTYGRRIQLNAASQEGPHNNVAVEPFRHCSGVLRQTERARRTDRRTDGRTKLTRSRKLPLGHFRQRHTFQRAWMGSYVME